MDLDLKDKVALVTAASSGLGKAAALQLAREGAKLGICSRGEAIQKAAEEIQKETGVNVLPFQADLTRSEDIERLVSKTFDAFGRIDILIINAGGPPSGNFLDLTPEDWEKAFPLIVMSAVRLCYQVLPSMLENEFGSIVAIESISVRQPIDNLILSNSLRMAVIGLIKSLANTFGSKGIRANSINPTWTHTERVEQLLTDRAEKWGTSIEKEFSRVSAEVPLGRMGTVEEFGRTIAWLASPAASFINGHALMFDGGALRVSL
jgi:3-oxoacyl-[acyl-carrier protein] reductase